MDIDPGNENGQRLQKTNINKNSSENTTGKTPVTKSCRIELKRTKKRDLESDEDYVAILNDQLEKERESNKELKKEISKMNKNLEKLNETILDLSKTVKKIQKEKDDIAKELNNMKAKDAGEEIIEMSDSSDEEEDGENKKTSNTETGSTQNQTEMKQNVRQDTTTNKSNEIQRSNNIPPIDIWSTDRKTIQTIIHTNMPKNSCTFITVNKSKFRIIAQDKEKRQKLMKIMKERKIQYNTYTPTDEKMINIILKGCEVTENKTIEEALQAHNVIPYKIQKFNTGYMRQNNIESKMWLVTIAQKTNTDKIFGIKTIDNWSVKWEYMKKPPIIQCKRCQRFNHSASNCSLPYRCVKCADKHEPGQCPLSTSENALKPTCINCKGEHTANNAKECPVFKRMIEIRAKNKNNPQTADRNKMQDDNEHNNNNRQAASMRNKSTYASVVTNTTKRGDKKNKHEECTDKSNNKNNDNTDSAVDGSRNSQLDYIIRTIIETQNKLLEYLAQTK